MRIWDDIQISIIRKIVQKNERQMKMRKLQMNEEMMKKFLNNHILRRNCRYYGENY